MHRNGPRVLILGPENAGKSSLVKLLTGYAIRIARQPVVVNLDPREGVMSVPGTLTATAFKTMMDVEEGWGSAPMSGPSAIRSSCRWCIIMDSRIRRMVLGGSI